MSTHPDLPDRLSTLGLGLVAVVNVLFAVAFLAFLLLATGKAQAEEPACRGEDMLAALAKDDPALLARIRAEAAQTPHGDGLLWRVARQGVADSFLFGTMHMADPRVTALPPAVQAAFDGADKVVIETLEVRDPVAMAMLVLEHPELMMFTDERTLPGLIADADIAMVEAALRARGVPLSSLRKTKPWIVAGLVALPACELAREGTGTPVLDLKIADEAEKAGKELAGLESLRDQLGAMASLPMEFHVRGLVETIRLGDRLDDIFETMIGIYLSGEVGLYWPFFRAVLPGADDEAGYAAFQETMIGARNRVMAERARPMLDEGGAFIAVGALHLPGEDGLVALLSEAGYSVSPVR